jgi:vacuolar-type H+-ATPase subunit F/Vma7
MEGKAAVLGNADFVMPFSALGLDTFAVEADPENVTQTASEILQKRYALIVVAENVAPMAQEVFATTVKHSIPCIVVVPFTTESEGFATRELGKVLKIATGIDILAN